MSEYRRSYPNIHKNYQKLTILFNIGFSFFIILYVMYMLGCVANSHFDYADITLIVVLSLSTLALIISKVSKILALKKIFSSFTASELTRINMVIQNINIKKDTIITADAIIGSNRSNLIIFPVKNILWVYPLRLRQAFY
ncbi:MAG: hypothetical protein NC393_04025 [Clostridium sp.]|nr:hypothetical protein [Clostridium sp.]MCM1171276.1 hypothetical protein [Clostridium sp.]MCM1207454.1 hypothetical protein [Ruminococcus sp.]